MLCTEVMFGAVLGVLAGVTVVDELVLAQPPSFLPLLWLEFDIF